MIKALLDNWFEGALVDAPPSTPTTGRTLDEAHVSSYTTFGPIAGYSTSASEGPLTTRTVGVSENV